MKVLCSVRRCNWHGDLDEILLAQNPFEPEESLQGCPKCSEVNTIRVACDEPDCWQEATCGWPSPSGYRRTCGEHMRELKP